jgi:hypothetical protein
MTISQFIENPLPLNRAISIKLIQHAQRLHQNLCDEELVVSIQGIEYFGGDDVDGWFKKEWEEFSDSISSASMEQLERAVDLMLSSWWRASIMMEIEKRI